MRFDRKKFFDGYREKFSRLSQGQVGGLETLLAFIEGDEALDDIRHVSYILATVMHETAATFQPIEEYGRGRGRAYGKPDPITGQTYYGRGLVQLTWRDNYRKFSEKLGLDLVNNPDLAMRPDVAWAITSIGMREGTFTGKKLSDYINDSSCDYRRARRVINRMDKAMLIGGHALKFESILRDSLEECHEEAT